MGEIRRIPLWGPAATSRVETLIPRYISSFVGDEEKGCDLNRRLSCGVIVAAQHLVMSTTETIIFPAIPSASVKPVLYAGEPVEDLPLRGPGRSRLAQDLRLEDLPPPSTAVEALERWNHPRRNMYGIFGTYLSFFVLGLNDATPGALIPYLEEYYQLSYTVVSLLFLSPCLGFTLAAALNNSVHRNYGQRGVAFIAGLCHTITYLTLSLHPPWPVIVVFVALTGFGNGLADAGWCAWTGNMVSANKVQGFLQAFYSLGATFSPLIATSMIAQGKLQWYTWYYVMTGIAIVEWILCTAAFWHKDGAKYRAETVQGVVGSTTMAAIKNKVTLLCGAFFLIYVGAEVALGGWIVTFMIRVRQAGAYESGISLTGFWAGMTVGRALLGFITERWGERRCVAVYLALALGLELIFWLVPRFVSMSFTLANDHSLTP